MSLKFIRNKIVLILSFPFNLIFQIIPLFFESILFKLLKDKSVVFNKKLNSKTIFLVNSKSGRNMGKSLMELLKRSYNVENICDITKEDPKNFLDRTRQFIRSEYKVNILKSFLFLLLYMNFFGH